MRVLVGAAARTAHRVITLSAASRDDLVANLGLDAAKIDVVPLGVRAPRVEPLPAEDVRQKFGLDGRRVILCVAQKRPYKNLPALVRAVAEVDDRDVALVLPGAPTPHEAELRSLADELGVTDAVRFPAWVSEEELEGLYALADCFVLPSAIEGFGLPVLEAMQRGVPVACSDRSALREVAGDAALRFEPEDQAAVTAAVRQLLYDDRLAERFAERGLARCREFPWRRTADLTLASYERALAARRRAPSARLRGRLGRS
jgi:glycosyltransferase involved in cell wall biosynthesis